jgi:predicted esterase
MSSLRRFTVTGSALFLSCTPARAPTVPAPAASSTTAVTTNAAPAPVVTPATVTSAPPAPTPAAQLPPSGFSELAVPNYETAVVSFPAHPSFPEPIVIVAHGAGDTPDALCRVWRDILGDRGVLLCPAGPRMQATGEGRYFPDHPTLERIVFASLDALHAAYPNFVAPNDAIYAGYSQGATMGALMIVAHGKECPRVVLTEGGVADWSVARAAEFRDGGGRRVLFVCGRERCRTDAERAAISLRKAAVDARVVSHVGAGHTYGGAIAAKVRDAFDWLVSDDPRWHR